jgi:aldose 1-epimerase
VAESQVCLAAGDARLEVDLVHGARAEVWQVGDLDLIGAHDAGPVGHGAFLMAPWPGRVRGNLVRHLGVEHPLVPTFGPWAIHGTVLDARAEIVEVGPDVVRTVTPLGPTWPWAGRVHHSWQLTEESLTARMSVESQAEEFPAEVGWHPWFRRRLRRGGALEVDLPASYMLQRGADHLPSGDRVERGWIGPFDDAFFVPSGRARLTWPGALVVDVESSCPWYVLYDEPADWVCVEPQTAPPDGLADGFVVRPGRSRDASVTWRWRRR